MKPQSETNRWSAIRHLRAARPKNLRLRASAAALALLVATSWCVGPFHFSGLVTPARRANLKRFATHDAIPKPLRTSGTEGHSGASFTRWVGELWSERGADAALRTLCLAVVAIALAAAFSVVLSPLAARSLMTRDPYLERERRLSWWTLACAIVRWLLVGMRAIPEYVWAFLLLAVFGPGAWPVILALAIHNAGILGRLMGETLENQDPQPMVSLRALGATRSQIAWTALRPLSFGRCLLFLFYRLETCVREATVLGLLGVVSLGYWIQDARARQLYDELLFFVALGGCLVLMADIASSLVRAWVRRMP